MVIPQQELVFLLKSKNPVSFAECYDTYSAALYGIIIDIVPDQEVASTLLQKTFTEIWLTIETYDPSRSRLFTWMQNIACTLSYHQAGGTTNGVSVSHKARLAKTHYNGGKPYLRVVPE